MSSVFVFCLIYGMVLLMDVRCLILFHLQENADSKPDGDTPSDSVLLKV